MDAHATRHNVALRPHMKTAKCVEAARIALEGRPPAATVATADEAWHLLAAGITDIRWAVALTHNKVPIVRRLLEAGAQLSVIVSDVESALALSQAFDTPGNNLPATLVELDCGEHRTGIAPDAPELIPAAAALSNARGIRFRGVLTHGGHAYGAGSVDEVVAIAAEERHAVVHAAGRLEAEGIACPERSIGSTPTVVHGTDFDGITEIRPGVYMFGDLFQMQLGTCSLEDIAVSVLATVIAADTANNRLVIDAGGLALSKDRSTQTSAVDYGYGLVAFADGNPIPGQPVVDVVHQEHGSVRSAAPLPFDLLAVGSQVRVLPNHACMTAAPYDRYYVVNGPDTQILTEWEKTRGW